ncbi:hypothetical protein [Prevotella sp. 10(H)]|uniref:LIC_10190 family membrane protein n=1 Tax=Prevotella sp. 10(H) TaxID=1158294 RepID=UPI0004A71722|nr:hypothetical protein [Prevotella sp. 10(H)]
MLIVLISWFIIFFVLFTFGDIFVSLYNKICKREEAYSVLDTVLLGIFFTVLPLSIISFFLPSNHYILFVYIIISAVYWIWKKEKAVSFFKRLKELSGSISFYQRIIIALLFISIVLIALWSPNGFDAMSYHYANIRWNEDYAVTPGIANLEDRFGFNSNLFLLDAIFTFRVFLGYPVYTLQSLFAILIFSWILIEVSRSKFDLKRVVLFVISVAYFYYEHRAISDTSTDILPGLITFYLVAKIILYPDTFKRNYLLYIFIPFALVGFKLSAAPFTLLSIFLAVIIIREKKYKPLIFIGSVLAVYFALWITRTVIISGYLIYPLHEVNLFSFDWQVPVETAMKQRYLIGYYANEYMAEAFRTGIAVRNKYYIILLFIYLLTFISIIISLYKAFKNKNTLHKYILATLILCLCYWFFFAHDFRFGSGYVFAAIFLGCVSLLGAKRYVFPKLSIAVISLLILWMTVFSFRFASYYDECLSTQLHISEASDRFVRMLIQPYSVKDKMAALKNGESPEENFSITQYKLNDSVSIGISTYPSGWYGDSIPCIANKEGTPDFWTIPDIRQIEARGNCIKDGFRTKKGFVSK